jgi:2-amino-4-hydroxy-6-hydroxymethyldihydropteridine diphosphokinase
VKTASTRAYLGLGSNLGDREEHLRAAVRALDSVDGIHVTTVSPVYASRAHTRSSNERQPDFLNAVVRVEVTLAPEELLRECRRIELERGRETGKGTWQPRSLDIDILLFGDLRISRRNLVVPHKRLADRLFVLVPLADVAGHDSNIPVLGQTVQDLIDRCKDPDQPVQTLVDLSPSRLKQDHSG